VDDVQQVISLGGVTKATKNFCTDHPALLHLFIGVFSRTAWLSRHQKGRTVLDFNEARDDGVVVASAGHYVDHLHIAPDRCQHLIIQFLQGGCFC